jgi:hypothetical protein
MINWRRLSSCTPSASPIAGRAGSMASIASAFVAINAAIMAMNSRMPGPVHGFEAVVTERSFIKLSMG